MANLLAVDEARSLVKTPLDDTALNVIIERIEAQISARIGASQDDSGSVTISETVRGEGSHLFVKVAFSEIVSITEDGSVLDADDYCAWGESGMIERLPEGCEFGRKCVVIYKPVDQRAQRKAATINLLRLTLERTAMASESFAGEYTYSAPEWDKEFKRELKNLCFPEV